MTTSSVLLGPPLCGKTTRVVGAYAALARSALSPEQIVCLSFFSANAASIRAALREMRPPLGERFPWVTTLQRFQSLLLRDYAAAAGVPARARELTPEARALILRQAWQDAGGPLWQKYKDVPGAVRELTKVVDWLSQNRTRFAVVPGELGNGELAQVYQRYIDWCLRHRQLTFQEASLRCLDLLADSGVAADVHARFPAVLVDDLHLARPDQVALVAALHPALPVARVGAGARPAPTRAVLDNQSNPGSPVERYFMATAWLHDGHAAPELSFLRERVRTLGQVEQLSAPAPGVNPHIVDVVSRLVPPKSQAADFKRNAGTRVEPVTLTMPPTAEDELHEVAQAIVQALVADETLRPSEIAIVAADARLLPFAQRVLAQYGLPIPPAVPAAAQTPLVRGSLLALRLRANGPDAELERDLLALPYVNADPLERSALYAAALRHGQTILALADDQLPVLSTRTRELLARVRDCIAALDPAQPAVALQAAARALGGLTWVWEDSSFPQAQRDAWARAFVDWLARVRELEQTIQLLGAAPPDLFDVIAALPDDEDITVDGGAIQLADKQHVNGVQARLAFVVGLSEGAAPARHALIQLADDAELQRLFVDGRKLVLPQAREPEAWLEREARLLAALLSRGRERLRVSVSGYGPGGDAQLPSPFFERLLGPDGEIDREGQIKVKASETWVLAESPASPTAASLLPWLAGAHAEAAAPGSTTEVVTTLIADSAEGSHPEPAERLANHTFSASQIRMYLTCPLQFFYGRVLRIEQDESPVFEKGSLIHELLCAALGDGSLGPVDLRARKRPGWLSDTLELQARAQAALQAAWVGTPAQLPGGGRYVPGCEWREAFGPGLTRTAVLRWAERLLGEWADFESERMAAGNRRPILLETSFALTLDGYRVTGRIDRIDELTTKDGVTYELMDYKTGSTTAGESVSKHMQKFLPQDGEAPADFQLPLYALALMAGVQGLRAAPALLSYVNVEELARTTRGKFSTKAARTIQVVASGAVDYKTGSVPLTVLQGEVRQGIVDTLGRMSLSPYPAQPGFYCAWCSFRAACDRGRAQVREDA